MANQFCLFSHPIHDLHGSNLVIIGEGSIGQSVAEIGKAINPVLCVGQIEGGVLQVHRRISTPEALAWTEQTRHMFAGTYADYALGALDERCFAMPAPG